MPLPVGTQMPSFSGATQWLNGEIPTENLWGCPTIVHFWAVSCPSCKRNWPHLQRLVADYGLQLVSVHRPRMEADLDVSKVKAAMEELGLDGPCAIDNNHTIGDLFQTGGAWPTYFLFDAQSKLRSRSAGQLGLNVAENSLKRMLAMQQEGGKYET